MFGNDLHEVYIETSKILQKIVTTPMKTAEADKTFSLLKRMILDDRPIPSALMSIKRHLVVEINNFDDGDGEIHLLKGS